MPKQQKKVIASEESESDHVESATDEEIESEAGESEAEVSTAGESEEEGEAPAIDASATESDEDDEEDNVQSEDSEVEDDEEDESEGMDVKKPKVTADSEDDDDDDDDEDDEEVDDDEDVPQKKIPKTKGGTAAVPEHLVKNITKQITETYDSRKGLQLFVRLPEKLPTDFKELEEKMKAISPLIVKVHKPRQKYARFCLVDFANQEDRDKVYRELSEGIEESKLTVGLPRTESEEFIKKLIDKKVKKLEKVRANKILKKEGKKAAKQKKFTSNLLVFNIPKSASMAQIRELFPDAVDIQLKPAPKNFTGVCTAAVTCQSTQDARKNQNRKLTLGGNKLYIRFDTGSKKTTKGPVVPNAAANGDKPKNKKKPAAQAVEKPDLGKKRLNDDDDEAVPEKKAKVAKEIKTKSKPQQMKQTQSTNGTAKTVKGKQNQQKKSAVNQKKEAKVKGQSPQKKNVPGKKPFAKKQQTSKTAAKKAKAVAK